MVQQSPYLFTRILLATSIFAIHRLTNRDKTNIASTFIDKLDCRHQYRPLMLHIHSIYTVELTEAEVIDICRRNYDTKCQLSSNPSPWWRKFLVIAKVATF
jgi:hypothetical protein